MVCVFELSRRPIVFAGEQGDQGDLPRGMEGEGGHQGDLHQEMEGVGEHQGGPLQEKEVGEEGGHLMGITASCL